MKIRTGFVSNSSSSSFCILGVCIDKSQFVINGKTIDEIEKESGEDFDWYDFDIDECPVGDLETFKGYEGDDDSVYIGISPQDFDDNETVGQIKERIAKTLKEAGINIGKQKIEFHEQSTGNG